MDTARGFDSSAAHSELGDLYNGALAHMCEPGTDPYRAFARGELVRLRRGAYVPTEVWNRLDGPMRFRLSAAALVWTQPQTVFCGETALFLRGLPVVKTPATLDVATETTTRLGARPPSFEVRGTTPDAVKARGNPAPSVRRHQHRSLAPQLIGSFYCVPLHDAVAEVLGSAKFARALTVADGVLRLNPAVPLLDRAPLLDAIGELTFEAQRTRARLRAELARSGSESPGESVSRALMLLWGFPQPQLQCTYFDAQGFVARTDFTWSRGCEETGPPEKTLRGRVGEFDGWGKYFGRRSSGPADAVHVIQREKRRENRLIALGYPVLRWDWADLERPARLRAKLGSFGLSPSRSAALDHKCA